MFGYKKKWKEAEGRFKTLERIERREAEMLHRARQLIGRLKKNGEPSDNYSAEGVGCVRVEYPNGSATNILMSLESFYDMGHDIVLLYDSVKTHDEEDTGIAMVTVSGI